VLTDRFRPAWTACFTCAGDGDAPSGTTIMSDTSEDAARPVTVGHRLRHARQRWFLGRDGELELFRGALRAPEPPFTVLHVAAGSDPVLGRAFLRVVNLIDPPEHLMRPELALRVMRGTRAAS
jgi:hypothetical protein